MLAHGDFHPLAVIKDQFELQPLLTKTLRCEIFLGKFRNDCLGPEPPDYLLFISQAMFDASFTTR